VKVLVITPRVDPDDDLLGFIHTWMSSLARRVERLYVIQLWSGRHALPRNARVVSLGKDAGASKPVQFARFARAVGQLCLAHRVDAVLAHMGPIFAVCAAPFTRLAGLPLVLWYAHGSVSPTLRVAHRLVDIVGTSSPAGFRIPSAKVRYTGQGIDTERFSPPDAEPTEHLLVTVGRISPVKDLKTVLRALNLLAQRGRVPRLEIVGGTYSQEDRSYLADLRQLAASLDLQSQVRFLPGVPYHAVAPVFQRSTLFLSASRTGSLDKAILEALSCGRLALTSNEAFSDFFGPDRDRYVFPVGDHVALADRLETVISLAPDERRVLGLEMRQRVVLGHGVDHLAGQLLELLTEASARR
jgi:glycosyltransferase involved in cell wall biosynthesis